MVDDQRYDEFVIPQKGAGRHFRDLASKSDIEAIRLETAAGEELVDLPIHVDVERTVPTVFRVPMQAVLTVTSIFTRLLGLNLIFSMKRKEK